MAQRLHYTPDVFRIVDNILGGDESGSKVVYVWCLEKDTIKVPVPMEDPEAFAKSLEAVLMEHDQFKDRFEKGEQADSDDEHHGKK